MDANRSDDGGCVARLAPLVAVLAVAWAVFVVTASFPASDPDHQTGFRYAFGIASTGLLALVLFSHQRAQRRSTRVWLGATALLLTASGVAAAYSEYFAHYRMLWWVMFPTLLLATVVAWLARCRWLAILTTAGVLTVAVAALPPSGTSLPIVKRDGGMSLTLTWIDQAEYGPAHHVRLVLDGWSAPRRDSLHRPRINTSIAGIVPLSGRPDLVYSRAAGGGQVLGVWSFPPDWTRSFDLEVSVPTRPAHPSISLEVPVPAPGKTIMPQIRGSGDGASVLIRRITDQGSAGGVRSVELELIGRGTDLLDPAAVWVGPPGKELRINGRNAVGTPERDDVTLTVELPDERETIEVDVLSREQIPEAWRTFRFSRLPNPRRGESFGRQPTEIYPDRSDQP